MRPHACLWGALTLHTSASSVASVCDSTGGSDTNACARPSRGARADARRAGGAAVVLLLFVGVLGALGRALLGRGRLKRAADLAAVSGARSMRDDFPRRRDTGRAS